MMLIRSSCEMSLGSTLRFLPCQGGSDVCCGCAATEPATAQVNAMAMPRRSNWLVSMSPPERHLEAERVSASSRAALPGTASAAFPEPCQLAHLFATAELGTHVVDAVREPARTPGAGDATCEPFVRDRTGDLVPRQVVDGDAHADGVIEHEHEVHVAHGRIGLDR